jgi:NAD(P)-dependent dehydrogenase (short-subunit alcohol dehydrogenase family)
MTHSPIEIWRGNDWSTEGPDRAGGRTGGLARAVVLAALDADARAVAAGPLMLAKHLAPRMNPGGSSVIFSGVAATKIAVGTMGVAITNAAADTLARSLALELAPLRVSAISPGVIDTGAWDAPGEQAKADYFAVHSASNPAHAPRGLMIRSRRAVSSRMRC